MPHRTLPGRAAPCVLALMIHPGHSGYAALDGFGERAFGTTQLSRVPSERASILVRLIGRLARHVRPTRVVLGAPCAADPLAATLLDAARRACRRLRLDVVEVSFADLVAMVGRTLQAIDRGRFPRNVGPLCAHCEYGGRCLGLGPAS